MKPIHVHIENFQSIENLDFSIYGFTCITGKSNIGKSAITRAIYRCIMNETVKGAVRHGKKFVTVSLTSDWSIWWKKGEKGNEYEVNGKAYSNTGQKQLPEIADLGFRSVRVGDQDVTPWYANQYEPVFLLNKSGGQITEFISEISRLKVVQESIQRSISLKKKSTDKAGVHRDEISRLSKRVSSFIGIETASDMYKKLEEEKNIIDGKKNVLSKLIPLSEKAVKAKTGVVILEPIKSISVGFAPDSYSKWELGSNILRKFTASKTSLELLEPVKQVSVHSKDLGVSIRVLEVSSLMSKLKSKLVKPDFEIPDAKNRVAYLERLETLCRSMKKINIGSDPPRIPNKEIDVEKFENASRLLESMKSKKSEVLKSSIEFDSINNELAAIDAELSSFAACPFCGSTNASCVKDVEIPETKRSEEPVSSQEPKSKTLTLDDFDL